jgi:2-dehydropantoate 2-reductase
VKGLLDIPALAIETAHVVIHAEDGNYAVCLTLQQAREYGVLVYELDGNVNGVVRIEVTRGRGRETRQTTCPPPPG